MTRTDRPSSSPPPTLGHPKEVPMAFTGLMPNAQFLIPICGTVVTVVLVILYALRLRREEKVRVGQVSQLLIYPLKSARSVSVKLAECHKMGLRNGALRDRHWMVVTEEGRMVIGTHEPRLVLVSLSCDGDQEVRLTAPDMDELRVPLRQPRNLVLNCRLFGDDIQGRDCGAEAAHWLTTFLGGRKTYRLVHFEPHMKTRKSWVQEKLFPRREEVAYAYAGPLLLLSQASVEDLSKRTEKDLTAQRFRPNIVIEGCSAFDEDSWDELQVGEVRLQRVMSCPRCMSTTIDPDTGVINRKEPLETLKGYRQCKPSERSIYKAAPLFGQLFLVKKTGKLQVGDVVYKISH
ncbi:hypothetical protein NHX12_019393 [Muraenolepis orangiensis]|uniref:MOSC domain-containing protein n=1 Tax=Muraenolepis orangiensis TaxID=630683 RepID=A0A9Q0EWP1_9TELE|nr:hypothetical protein NHX12_019393 [Muraenolepis orangiensis]